VASIVSDADDYVHEVVAALRAAGVRAEADMRNEKINYKVREHSWSAPNGEMVGVVPHHAKPWTDGRSRQVSTWSRSRPAPSRRSARSSDYGKYKYEEQKKKNEARKHQKVIEVKEIKFRPEHRRSRLRREDARDEEVHRARATR
jgi:translation initiation factor IF-3